MIFVTFSTYFIDWIKIIIIIIIKKENLSSLRTVCPWGKPLHFLKI